MSKNHPSENPSITEIFDRSLHEQISIFADSFGPVGHFVEDMERSVSRLPPEGEWGVRLIAGSPYNEDDRIFISLYSSERIQVGLERIAIRPYRNTSHNRPIDPKIAFINIKATYKMVIEGNS